VTTFKKMSKKLKQSDITNFLAESNAIEGVYSSPALDQAKKAWNFAYKYRDDIDFYYVLTIHKKLMEDLNPGIAGKIRNCSVRIGGRTKYFISEALLSAELRAWISNSNDLIDELLKDKTIKDKKLKDIQKDNLAKQLHVLFEEIHPFEDGNGRVGRILYNIHRILLDLPIDIIHEGEEQMEYYTWFN
jgi:fido (protein-threonine AMPylation protein)